MVTIITISSFRCYSRFILCLRSCFFTTVFVLKVCFATSWFYIGVKKSHHKKNELLKLIMWSCQAWKFRHFNPDESLFRLWHWPTYCHLAVPSSVPRSLCQMLFFVPFWRLVEISPSRVSTWEKTWEGRKRKGGVCIFCILFIESSSIFIVGVGVWKSRQFSKAFVMSQLTCVL